MSRRSLDRALEVGTPHFDAIESASREFNKTVRAALDRPAKPWKFAALEAERLTSDAEPDASLAVPMSGGAEPAGAAKPSHD